MNQKVNVLLSFLFFFMSFPLWAQNDVDDEALEPLTWQETLIQDNIVISEWFDGVAEGLDLFLVGKKISKRKNETHVILANSSFVQEAENLKNTTSINANIRLPNVEEYWQLKFTSYDESQERRGVQNGYLRNTPRQRNYGTTIGFFRKLGNVRTSFQPRIDLGDPLKVSHSLGFESVADMKTYEINPKLEFFSNPDQGGGVYMALNFHRSLTQIFSFTLINNGNYLEKSHLFSVTNGFSFGQWVSNRSSLAYNWLFFSNNQSPYHLDGYSLSVVWSQTLYKRILDYQVIPHLDFIKDDSFRGRVGLTFNLNLNF